MKKIYCSVEITDDKFKAFTYAIKNHYWYQMYIGELQGLLAVCMYVLFFFTYMLM